MPYVSPIRDTAIPVRVRRYGISQKIRIRRYGKYIYLKNNYLAFFRNIYKEPTHKRRNPIIINICSLIMTEAFEGCAVI